MAAAKGSKKEPFIKLCPAGLPTCRATVSLNIGRDDKPNVEVNADLFIINMNVLASCTQEIIMGDRILKINGATPKSAAEAANSLSAGAGQVKLIVERRQNAEPVSLARLKKIGCKRMEGFSYCLVKCINTGKHARATLGFTLSLMKNKAHIISVEAGSIASQHFALGDALLDVDGEAIPFADLNFLKTYAQKFFKEGQFTAVIERPTTPQRREQYMMLYKMMLPQTDAEVEMGADAIKIGMEAAAMHNLVFRKIQPRSCLTVDAARNISTITTITATQEDKSKEVKIAASSVMTIIGSDVEDEDDLKKVERKSHSKEQMNYDDM